MKKLRIHFIMRATNAEGEGAVKIAELLGTPRVATFLPASVLRSCMFRTGGQGAG
jgi:hypothetical protein